MRKSLRKRLLLLILSFVFLLNVVSVSLNYQNYVSTMEQSAYATASTVAETCALIIDGDKFDVYKKSQRRDTSYYETWNKLIDYRSTNENIEQLCVGWFSQEGFHYIFDTDLTDSGAFLGDRLVFDMKQKAYKEELIDGEDIGYITYSDHVTAYLPVYSSYNIKMGYVIVAVSTTGFEEAQYRYLRELICFVLVLTLLITFLFIWRISRTIIRPINQLSQAAATYVDSVTEKPEDSPLARLAIHTGDEIEKLFHSLKKMETDIWNSSNNLAVAMWNSHHDSMTQVFNKRYLEESIEVYETKNSLGVVYFDVDNLKKMNDICGHEAGDEVIKKTADFIKKYQGPKDAGFRMGGDEFMLVVVDRTEEEMAELAATMKADPDHILTPPESKVQCRIAMGYAFVEREIHFEELMKKADQNMYSDKQSHR